MKKFITAFAVSVITIGLPAQTYKIYRGLLHAHTMISDGSGTPEEAYKMAKQNGLDFFAITEHNHAGAENGIDASEARKDGIMIAKNNDLYNGKNQVTVTIKNGTKVKVTPLIQAAKISQTATFLPLYGQEFSTIGSGNHMNIIGIDEVIKVGNGDFKGLVELLQKMKSENKPMPVIQLNHPGITADLFAKNPDEKCFNDYGIHKDQYGPHFKDLVNAIDPYVSLIEMLSGPATDLKKIGKYPAKYLHENDYFFYLKQGFHISPSAGQDNHYKNWGSVSDARIGVLAETLTQKDIFEAISKNRTFATDDKNLGTILKVNGQTMGSSITGAVDSKLSIELAISDKDEPKAKYTVSVYGGVIEPQNSTNASNWKAADGLLETYEVAGDGTFTIDDMIMSGDASFIYVKVEQEDGNRLWTAPVWMNEGAQTLSVSNTVSGELFYWTKSTSSKIYHKSGCSAIKTIATENLTSGTKPPADRTLHVCKVLKNVPPEGDED